jgi:predicted component of type VI protein secretion system
MKVSLVVKSSGKMENKTISVPGSQFLIGRDSKCQLRPNSPLISNKHCAILIRGEKAFLRDLVSTNGTSVNDKGLQGEIELKNGDKISLGALVFSVLLEQEAPVRAPVPAAASHADDLAASLLLGMTDEPAPPARSEALTESDINAGTVEHGVAPGVSAAPAEATKDEAANAKLEQVKQAQADTAIAASAILTKYLRRR